MQTYEQAMAKDPERMPLVEQLEQVQKVLAEALAIICELHGEPPIPLEGIAQTLSVRRIPHPSESPQELNRGRGPGSLILSGNLLEISGRLLTEAKRLERDIGLL